MKDYGLFRVAAAVPTTRVADTGHNAEEICRLAGEAFLQKASLVVFPELSVTGHSCGDLFGLSKLQQKAEEAVSRIADFSRDKETAIIVGAPVSLHGRLYNCAIVLHHGEIKGIVPKTQTTGTGYSNFCSGRNIACETVNFAGQSCIFSSELIFRLGKASFAIEISGDLLAPIPVSSSHCMAGADIILNLSAGNEVVEEDIYLKERLASHSRACICGYIYTSGGYGESSQDLVYSGAASVWENGKLLDSNERFTLESSLIITDIDIEKLNNLRIRSRFFCDSVSRRYIQLGEGANTDFDTKLLRDIDPHPFVPAHNIEDRCSKVTAMQRAALSTRLNHINCNSAVLGISGGLDSTLALLVTALAFDATGRDRKGITGITMPGFGTTERTKGNASDLMEALGITSREISIANACRQHFNDIGHDIEVHDVTYENAQARERTQILMDIANQTGGIVIGTGDLSELALGWATYNGDHMSMYGINADIPKTLVKSLVKWIADNMFEGASANGRSVKEILYDIIDTPISPELLPATESGDINQITEDLVGPYELHDFFLYNLVRCGYSPEKIFFLAKKAFQSGKEGTGHYDDQTIQQWLKTFVRRFFNQQFKRSCMPDGPKVGSVGLSPRGDWNMPSDAWSSDFLRDL